MQAKVVHSAHPTNLHSGKRTADSVHQRATGFAEIVSHSVVLVDAFILAESGEVVFAADMAQVGIEHGEVCGEEAGGYLVAVAAVAEEDVC